MVKQLKKSINKENALVREVSRNDHIYRDETNFYCQNNSKNKPFKE